MVRVIVALLAGAMAGFLGCAILTAGALADARSESGVYARLVGKFMSAYQDQNVLAIIAVYNDAKRICSR